MNLVKSVIVESAAAPCVVAISKTEAAKIEKGIINAAKELGVGKKAKRTSKQSAEPRVKRAPKPSSKQATVNALVKGVFEDRDPMIKPSKEFKQQIISEIMQLCNMTQAGATTYFYNALKTL